MAKGGTTREWVFTAAETDLELIAFAAPLQGVVMYVDVTAANSNTGDVSCRLGFHATALPAVSDSTGVDDMVFSHGGIAKGGGAVKSNGGEPITTGAAGASLLWTCSAPTGGSIRLLVSFRSIDQTV